MNLMCDITSNCNLRCPFCTNNWSKVRGNRNMTERTFGNVLMLAESPAVGDDGLFISCAFEPLIHPAFGTLLEMIPGQLKTKAFFSTNLAAPLSDSLIDSIVRANIDHVNVSFESFRPETYEFFRRGADYRVFIDNLKRLSDRIRATESAPQLYFITMLFQQNLDEIEDMVALCFGQYGAGSYEVRTPFRWSVSQINPAFLVDSYLEPEEASRLKEKLSDDRIAWRIDQEEADYYPNMRITSDGKAEL